MLTFVFSSLEIYGENDLLFIVFSCLKEENEAYKNRLANGNNDWIGSRSTSALNGRVTPLSTAGKRCLMMQYVYSLIYARHVYEFAPI